MDKSKLTFETLAIVSVLHTAALEMETMKSWKSRKLLVLKSLTNFERISQM